MECNCDLNNKKGSSKCPSRKYAEKKINKNY